MFCDINLPQSILPDDECHSEYDHEQHDYADYKSNNPTKI